MKKDIKNRQKGFSMVEVLVSIMIISFVIVTFNQLAISAYYNWEDARKKSVAYNLIQSTMEDLRNRRDVNVDLTGTQWSDPPFLPDGDNTLPSITVVGDVYTVKVNVTSIPMSLPNHLPSPDSTLKKRIIITIGWSERVGPRSMQAETYFTNWKGKY